MISHIHQKLGTAGFIISIVALVAALGGGAYAASGGLTGKQKKEVQKIAQTEAKKFAAKPGATGAQGAAGAQGPAGAPGAAGEKGPQGDPGAKGETGAAGETGAPGAKGNPGASPTVVELPVDPTAAKCKAGGAKIIGVTSEEVPVCNGEGGSGSSETLPSGHTEAGNWEVLGENGIVGESGGIEFLEKTISFPIRLASAPTETVFIQTQGSTPSQEESAKCPGTMAEPEAAVAGVFCMYSNGTVNEEPFALLVAGPTKIGATLLFTNPQAAVGTGSWAIKAP